MIVKDKIILALCTSIAGRLAFLAGKIARGARFLGGIVEFMRRTLQAQFITGIHLFIVPHVTCALWWIYSSSRASHTGKWSILTSFTFLVAIIGITDIIV